MRIVVAMDGSEGGRAAAGFAAQLAAAGGEVVVVHAVGLLERSSTGDPVPAHEVRGQLHELVEGWCAPLAAAGVRWQAVVRDGDAVRVVSELAAEEGADRVVIGSRRLGVASPLGLGSTSARVAQEAPCPVALVPPGWRSGQPAAR